MAYRINSLDILRLLAAILVFFGHLCYGSDHYVQNTNYFQVFNIFKLGSFAVLVFFFLSGIALRNQTQKFGSGITWFRARLLRLLPMYWVTLFASLFGFYILGGQELGYPKFGYIFLILGVEALVPRLSIPPGNPPLWSLSVEILLSTSILFFGRNFSLRNRLKIYFIFLILLLIFPKYNLLGYFIFFYTGFLVYDYRSHLFSFRKLLGLSQLLAVFSLLVFPNLLLKIFAERYGILLSYLLTLALVVPLYVKKDTSWRWLGLISQRSYALYAVHYPILVLIDIRYYKTSASLSMSQFCLSLLLVFLATEIAYRLIEVPSIAFSRRILEKRKGNFNT